jgi:hypothetical protein
MEGCAFGIAEACARVVASLEAEVLRAGVGDAARIERAGTIASASATPIIATSAQTRGIGENREREFFEFIAGIVAGASASAAHEQKLYHAMSRGSIRNPAIQPIKPRRLV